MTPPSTPVPRTLPARRPGLWWRGARGLAVLVLAALSVAVLAWLTLHWGILPRIEQWRPLIEERAGAALGQPVKIGSIQVRAGGWVPALDLRDVSVLDKAGRTALALGQVQVALSPQSLLAWELRLAQLHVEGVQLEVRRDLKGRLHVAGLDVQADAAPASDDGAAADWLFSQQEVVIRRGVVRWTDELRGAPPLELRGVDIVLRNGLRRHELRLDATPPPAWGERFSLRGQFTQSLLARRGEWRRWSGTLYGDLPGIDVAALRTYVSLPFDLQAGRGAARAWIDLQAGQWRDMTADLALADVLLRMGPALQPLVLTQLSARLKARRDARGVSVGAEGLQFTTGEGVVWPTGDLSLAWQQEQHLAAPVAGAADPAAAPVTGGRLRASRLDLALMATIASRLPIGPAAERALAELTPAGVTSGLDLSWTGAFDAPSSYRAQGRIAGLALAPLPAASAGQVGRPGLRGADIEFEATETGGKAKLAIAAGGLNFPGVFEQPAISLDKFSARLDWRIQADATAGSPPAIELKVSEAQFANADAQGELQATWRTGKGPGFGLGARLPGEIDLSGRIVRATADRVAAYLPVGIEVQARRYVAHAIKSGVVDSGSFAVKGDLWQFPFQGTRDGVFKVTAKVRDVRFDYLPSIPSGSDTPPRDSPWPGFSAVQGDLVFDRSSLQLSGVQARLWGVQMRDTRARIDDLASATPMLQIDGEARGPAADLLRFVAASPVGQWIGGGLSEFTATGLADLKLSISVPLADAARTTVRGTVTLAGSDLRVHAGVPPLTAARGRVDFTQRGFTIVGASARALGGEAAFEGGTQADGSLRVTAQGTATAEGMKRAGELGPLAAIAAKLRGQAGYRLALGIVQGEMEMNVTSDLVGMESEWPAPLNKPAAVAWPLRWQTALVPGSLKSADGRRDTLQVDLGQALQVRLLRDVSGDGVRVLSGGVGIGEAAPASAVGVQVRASAPVVDLDAWVRAAQRWPETPGAGLTWPATQVTLRAPQLIVGERRMTQAVGDLQYDPLAIEAPWRGQVQADQFAGRLSWRGATSLVDPGRLTARLTRLALPPSESVDVEQLLDRAPPKMPALDIVIDELEYRGRKLGRLELQAVSRPSAQRAGAREWRLDKLDMRVPEAHLSATGTWAAPAVAGGARRMSMDFGVDLADSGKLGARFGWSDAVRGGKGRVQGQLAWDGSPLAPDFNSIDGQVNLALESGQFLRAEPGVGRLLGVLSLQSLPRRLLLDFRDVFQEGFAFDNVNGDVTVSRGRATTKNLRMRGVQAVVLMEGTADLVRETQDLHVLIVPEVNAGAASLAYAAINPAIALGTFLAQMVLREPLRAAGTREFRITGPMADPKVERVERAAGASAPSTAEPVIVEPRKKEPPG